MVTSAMVRDTTRPPRSQVSHPGASTVAIGAYFFVNGATYASWVPRLPEIREDLGVSDTALGLTLLGGGIGGLAMSVVSGRLVNRVGSRLATVATSLVLSCLLPLVAFAPVPAVLFATLAAIGAFDGLTDVAMNSQALQLQRARPRSILNRMHAVWSIGTLTGGLVASRAAAMGVSFRGQLIVTSLVLLVLSTTASRFLLPSDRAPVRAEGADGHVARAPRTVLAAMFGLGMLAILAELPATEWATLLMAERFDLDVGAAGFGFVGFAAGMVIGRSCADLAVDRIGAERARRGGGAVAGIGLLVACTGPVAWVSVVGFLVAGVGASTLFPMLVRRAGELVPGANGVAAASSGARLGILLGAPLMGAISDLTSRSVALAIIGVTAAASTALIPSPRDAAAAAPAGRRPDPHVMGVTPPP
jgi:predicted MFS family arabinose efflux permease